jgi:hypothetical protein
VDSIAPAGRIAGFATAISSSVLGIGLGLSSVHDLTCAGPSCLRVAAAAALLVLAALGLLALGVAIALSVRRRPIDEHGTTGWFWGLGVVFLASAIVTAWLVPSATCPAGGAPDATLGRCLLGRDRLPMTSWVWLEWLIVVGGLVGAVLIAKLRRHVWLNVMITVGALALVMGRLLT